MQEKLQEARHKQEEYARQLEQAKAEQTRQTPLLHQVRALDIQLESSEKEVRRVLLEVRQQEQALPPLKARRDSRRQALDDLPSGSRPPWRTGWEPCGRCRTGRAAERHRGRYPAGA